MLLSAQKSLSFIAMRVSYFSLKTLVSAVRSASPPEYLHSLQVSEVRFGKNWKASSSHSFGSVVLDILILRSSERFGKRLIILPLSSVHAGCGFARLCSRDVLQINYFDFSLASLT